MQSATHPTENPGPPPPNPGTGQASPRAKRRMPTMAWGLLFSGVFFLVLLELSARLFWMYWQDVPFFKPGQLVESMHYAYYPNIKPVVDANVARNDGYFDVLILGGSVVNEWYGPIGEILAERLDALPIDPVRVHNVSFPGHSSRDSYNKYLALSDSRFDIVLVYHGINDVPANNVPSEWYRDDYSHYVWNRGYNDLTGNPSATVRFLAAPYTARFGLAKIRERFATEGFVPRERDAADRSMLHFGDTIKTVSAFRNNIGTIVDTARARGEPVVLMSFAHYLPDDYTLEKFEEQALDYGTHHSPVELWGSPANVVSTIEAHNAAIRDLAEENGTLLVDQSAGIPGGAAYFDDICHLTPRGAEAFVDGVITQLQEAGIVP